MERASARRLIFFWDAFAVRSLAGPGRPPRMGEGRPAGERADGTKVKRGKKETEHERGGAWGVQIVFHLYFKFETPLFL